MCDGSVGTEEASRVDSQGRNIRKATDAKLYDSREENQDSVSRRNQKPRTMNASGGAQPPVWMSTHPSDEQRMTALNERLETALPTYQQARAAGEKPNCDRLR